MQELIDKWDDLKKALSHAKAIPSAKVSQPKQEEMPQPHPDHLAGVKYGYRNIPTSKFAKMLGPGPADDDEQHIGYMKLDGKHIVVRHGAAAQRTDAEHQMAKLVGADHMLPDQTYDHGINHANHHNEITYDPHSHGGTSYQELHDGKELGWALENEDLTKKLKDHWKNGDLHKLWALHYITNNSDMHPGNFKIGKNGLKAFDSDHAFYELPTGHSMHMSGGEPDIHYSQHAQSQLPSYLDPFIDHPNDNGIEAEHSKDQVAVKALNDHAANIDPKLFEQFGPHAAERAAKVKQALMSSDPTGEMLKLWQDHSDKTGDLKWNRKSKLAA